MPQVRPTILPSVPRVYEKVHTAVTSTFAEATGVKRRLVDWSLGVGRRASELRQQGKPVPRALAAQVAIADKLVFSKVKERLGGRLRIPISGGAPLAKEVIEFFDTMGIRIREGYGLTECTTAAATNTSERYRFGTVGPALPGFELKLAEDGELLIRSETIFAGYFKEPEATAAVLEDDGWLHSGDIATIDEDGFVTITDRKKDIIVTAGGKNIAPQNLENDLKTSRFVSQALVVGDRRPYPAALITLDPAEIGKWAAEQGIEGDVTTLASHPRRRRARRRHRRGREPRPLPIRAAQALRDPPARLRDGSGRGHADPEAQAPRRPRALRRRGRRPVRGRATRRAATLGAWASSGVGREHRG